MTLQISIKPIHSVVGAEVRGVDLSQPLSADGFAQIRQALDKHQMLLLRDQNLDQESLLAFARHFGEPEIFPDPNTTTGKVPQVLRLTNLNADNQPTGPGPHMARLSLAENWHSDSSYRAVPSYITFLHAIEIPTQGGDTHFTSMHASYDALPPELRERVEPLSAIHSWEYQRALTPGRPPMTDAERASTPPIAHRLVQRHPSTGRKLLFLSASARNVDGLPEPDSRNLLNELLSVATAPERVYTHKWRLKDLVMWAPPCTARAASITSHSPSAAYCTGW